MGLQLAYLPVSVMADTVTIAPHDISASAAVLAGNWVATLIYGKFMCHVFYNPAKFTTLILTTVGLKCVLNFRPHIDLINGLTVSLSTPFASTS